MAFKDVGYTPGADRLYVPEFPEGNRQDPAPVRVWLKTPTHKDKREISCERTVTRVSIDGEGKPIKDAAGNPQMEIINKNAKGLHDSTVARFVTRVENYDGPAGKVTTGIELVEHGRNELLVELYQEIMLELSFPEEEAKNSDGSPASSSQATLVSTSTASSACAPTTASPATAPEAGQISSVS